MLFPTVSDAVAVPVTGGGASAEMGSTAVLLLTPLEAEAAEAGVSGGGASDETGIEAWEEEEERWEEGEEKNGRADGAGLKRRKREDSTMKRVTAATIGRLRSETKERMEEMAIPPLVRGWGTRGAGAGECGEGGKGESSSLEGGGGRGRGRKRTAVCCARVGSARCRSGARDIQ